jgi:hypothetical protein
MTTPETPSKPTDQQADQDQSIGAIFSRLGPAAYLGIAWTAFPAICGFILLKNRKAASDFLLSFNADDSTGLTAGLLILTALFITTSGVGLLPTYAQAIIAG